MSHLSVCLVRLSPYLPVCPSVCLSPYLSVPFSACLSLCLSVHLSLCQCVCMPACLSVCLYACLLSVCPLICLYACLLSVCPLICLSVLLSVCPCCSSVRREYNQHLPLITCLVRIQPTSTCKSLSDENTTSIYHLFLFSG